MSTWTRMGRPPKGVAHVDAVEGSEGAKERLKTVLLSLSGELTRQQAAERIGVSVRRLRELRDEALSAAVASLEPRRVGRPPKPKPSAKDRELARLESEAEMLAWELEVSMTREELALLMPHAAGDRRGRSGKARASRTSRPGGTTRRGTRRGV